VRRQWIKYSGVAWVVAANLSAAFIILSVFVGVWAYVIAGVLIVFGALSYVTWSTERGAIK